MKSKPLPRGVVSRSLEQPTIKGSPVMALEDQGWMKPLIEWLEEGKRYATHPWLQNGIEKEAYIVLRDTYNEIWEPTK
ncbi:conserved hypothetical protein [Ricinus communis]|uniref:Uncharacterized protein n=1 Tax=Ricinus communis TaxID=3988 RepID=B9RHN3_RICCO|nr:conserved hypothetical protein [Ricinus communis]